MPHLCDLINKFTNWNRFKQILNEKICYNIRLLNKFDIGNTIIHLTSNIKEIAKISTPAFTSPKLATDLPVHLKLSILEKHITIRVWYTSRKPVDKKNFNTSAQNLKTFQ